MEAGVAAVAANPRLRRRLVDEAIRREFVHFIRMAFNTTSPGNVFRHNWHIEAIAHALTQVQLGETRRLIITMPPRCAKSIIASIAFPAFILGHDPTREITCISYADALAGQLSNSFRAVMSAPWYQRVFPATRIDRRKDSTFEVRTTRRGARFATTVGGSLTGLGGDILLIDDPLKAQEAWSETAREKVIGWASSTLASRLDDPATGAIILVMQRLHANDLAGHFLEQGSWTHLNLPAIAQADQTVDLGSGRIHAFRQGDLLHPDRLSLKNSRSTRPRWGANSFRRNTCRSPCRPAAA